VGPAVPPGPDRREQTLGELLYANKARTFVAEQAWRETLQAIGRGDQLALHAFFTKMHRVVFTLILRNIANEAVAEEVTLDVFCDVWRTAGRYNPARGSVVGWLMNQARSRAIDRLRFEHTRKRVSEADRATGPNGPQEMFDAGEQLRRALQVLTPQERDAIETAFFSELTYGEVAARLDQPVGAVKTLICSGLAKLRPFSRPEGPMSAASEQHDLESLFLHALQAAPPTEALAVETHVSVCSDCRQELETLRPIISAFVCWPTDVLRPSPSLWDRLVRRITTETGQEPSASAPRRRAEGEWEEAAPGIHCKVLATDTERERVSMLVRLAPGVAYPPHRHAGVEELHLLYGELWIEHRKLYPGDYNRAEPGTSDHRVWSETGCTCVLITSTRDMLALPQASPSADER
jgi:RNA polymerase sigma-70 factor (ECF subfamily)